MFEAEIKSMLKGEKEQIVKNVMSDLRKKIEERVVWGAEDLLQKEVSSFVMEHIVPEVRKNLLENKESMVALFNEASIKIGCEIAKNIQERVCKNIESWSGKEALKKLLD